jgi:Flp pilus assembly protein TadB
MPIDEQPTRRIGSSRQFRIQPQGFLGKLLAVAIGAVVLVLAVMFSLVVFAVVVTAGLLLGGYLWWKTRALRKQMRERPAGERIIQGEVIRDARSGDEDGR